MMLIGLLGGMSWESTAIYYRIMNETARDALGGLHSARVLLHSVDFEPIQHDQHEGKWGRCARVLVDAGRSLKAGGASFLVIATNTMHKLADEIEEGSGLPVLHIADPTGEAIRQAGHRKVGLLATRFTMEENFYRQRLENRFHLKVEIPGEDERADIHRIIYEELCLGVFREVSAARFRQIIDRMKWAGCESVILGCTEIGMIVSPERSALPVFDTTALHARAAVALALQGDLLGQKT
ncbi:aspartate/glutamate racemase family protein [Oricola thermophila]|uniref:Aspartate/glutamate racemase family protein n=1 Tax=Oricola thermophila TaxID=2742145 RepID=A0A6N1VGI2_9HYPH|nr:aspartate/glutamate racemase family protein [Oricola thermophila]QKV19991.1 aspartate/glutamate racemase family protein [Oricola thermophila]